MLFFRNTCAILSICLLCSFNITENTYSYAEITFIKKDTAKTDIILAPINKDLGIENLNLRIKSCLKSSEYGQKESKAFIEVYDDATNLVFKGWIFSSSPSISSFENKVLDISLNDCINYNGIDHESSSSFSDNTKHLPQ